MVPEGMFYPQLLLHILNVCQTGTNTWNICTFYILNMLVNFIKGACICKVVKIRWQFYYIIKFVSPPFACQRSLWSSPKEETIWIWKGVSQMSILLHKTYLVKWSTKGEEGGQNFPKTVHIDLKSTYFLIHIKSF